MNKQELLKELESKSHNCFIENLEEETYFEHDALSKSGLWKLEDSPLHYLQTTPPSDAKNFGKAVHLSLLQPEKFTEQVRIMPEFNLRTNAGKEDKEKFFLSNKDKIILDAEEGEAVMGIVKSFGNIKSAGQYLSNGKAEVSAFAELEGLKVKGRFDYLMGKFPVIIDIKTCKSASRRNFMHDVLEYGYYVQAAFYTDMAEKITGVRHSFGFMPIEKKPPYIFTIYQLDEGYLGAGRRKYQELMAKYKNSVMENKLIDVLVAPEWLCMR